MKKVPEPSVALLITNSNAAIYIAIENAEEIITYAPEWSIGYLRLGNLLHMQGKQSAAISLYEKALMKISGGDPGYQQLIQDKRNAEEKSKRYVDMISTLAFG